MIYFLKKQHLQYLLLVVRLLNEIVLFLITFQEEAFIVYFRSDSPSNQKRFK